MRFSPVAVLILLMGCARAKAPEPLPVPDALLPKSAQAFAPGEIEVTGPGAQSADLKDVETCGACHAGVVQQWKTSAHAWASFNNPLYRISVDRLRMEKGTKPSRMCASCHDVALLTEGAMDVPFVEAEDPRAHAALTCRSCHNVSHARVDGNGSYTLATDEIPLPSEGNKASLDAHLARVAMKPLRKTELCASCHRSFLDETTGNEAVFFGMDDYTPWQRSAFAGSNAERIDAVEQRDCRGCHMPLEDAEAPDVAAKNGKLASHRFLGGHTLLAAMRNDGVQLSKLQAFLKDKVTLDVGAVEANGQRFLLGEGAQVVAGEPVQVELSLRNVGVGHRFPGGVMDAQDTWLFVEVKDRSGAVVARQEENDAHVLSSFVANEDGERLNVRETHRFVTAVWNHTLAPREAGVVAYRFTVPANAKLPLSLEAKLLHRSRRLPLSKAACAEGATEVGKKFLEVSAKLNGDRLDPCVTPPVTELAAASLELGKPAASKRSVFERHYVHGLGLSRALQEQLEHASESFEAALKVAKAPREKAQALSGLGTVLGKQGRVDEALQAFAQARALAPGEPSLDKLEGDALAQVWRWTEAAAKYGACVSKTPNDLAAWQAFAMALQSAGQSHEAIAAAQKGLLLQPRDADLLRVQAVALRDVEAPLAQQKAALESFAHWAPPDRGPQVRGKCSAKVDGCARERVPVHVHELSSLGQEPK